MTDWVVDTNVPIVANGRSEGRVPSISCRESAVRFIVELLTYHTMLVDEAGAILAEYRRYLRPSGQPGVGDRFYQTVLQSSLQRVRRVALPIGEDGEYVSLPAILNEVGFDPSDRKFAALGAQEGATIANATDSDWVNDAEALAAAGVLVDNLCGCHPEEWFAA